MFEELIRRHPWEERFIQHLIVALMRAGYARQCLAVIKAAYPEVKRVFIEAETKTEATIPLTM